MAKTTPLFEEHKKHGGKMVDFAGWEMPVEFQGLRLEHNHVREKVGLFDVSHMGEIRVRGPKALDTLQWLTSNDVSQLVAGKAQYSLLTHSEGGIVDDLIVYCITPNEDYLLCVNAANKDKDFQWMIDNNKHGADITDESDHWGQVAIQGPRAVELVERLLPGVAQVAGFHFKQMNWQGSDVIAARTGYTGEDGFEVFVPWDKTAEFWQELFKQGEDLEVKPIGLGARDTLRTEFRLSLYGNEIDETTNPYAARLGWVVKPDAKDFLGKQKMLAQKPQLTEKLVGFKMLERGIPRSGYKLFSFDNKEIGRVTSGTMSPTLSENIGLGYIQNDHSEVGQEFLVEIRSRKVRAQVVKTPFVQTKGAK